MMEFTQQKAFNEAKKQREMNVEQMKMNEDQKNSTSRIDLFSENPELIKEAEEIINNINKKSEIVYQMHEEVWKMGKKPGYSLRMAKLFDQLNELTVLFRECDLKFGYGTVAKISSMMKQ